MAFDAAMRIILFIVICALGGALGESLLAVNASLAIAAWIAGIVIAILIASSVRMTAHWQRAIVLSLGRFSGIRGPGLFFIAPLTQSVNSIIDLRIVTSTFRAEQAITADTVPVDVDAVLFWRVSDAKKAALEVVDYEQAVGWAAQTGLRDVIGRSTLADILSGREAIDRVLKELIDGRTGPWGVQVESVEIRDVKIPPALQDAMSRQAQAERERQARIILGESETQIAAMFMEAATLYEKSPTALHLRAMNMLYEGMKDKGSMIVVPSSALDTMNLGVVNFAALQGAGIPAIPSTSSANGASPAPPVMP